MLKAGIFLDMENLKRNGGWGLRFDAVLRLTQAQGTTVVRANAYLAVDSQRETLDREYRDKVRKYRDRLRRSGLHVVEKETKRYFDDDGVEKVKSNSDLDMAIDALLQAENLDYILLGTGDGDFVRLVTALQDKGKRVDGFAFQNVSSELRRSVDYYFPGAIVPGILPFNNEDEDATRERGILGNVSQDKGFGFITTRNGYGLTDTEEGIFCHISELSEDGVPVVNERLAELGRMGAVIEYDREDTDKGVQAKSAVVFQPGS